MSGSMFAFRPEAREFTPGAAPAVPHEDGPSRITTAIASMPSPIPSPISPAVPSSISASGLATDSRSTKALSWTKLNPDAPPFVPCPSTITASSSTSATCHAPSRLGAIQQNGNSADRPVMTSYRPAAVNNSRQKAACPVYGDEDTKGGIIANHSNELIGNGAVLPSSHEHQQQQHHHRRTMRPTSNLVAAPMSRNNASNASPSLGVRLPPGPSAVAGDLINSASSNDVVQVSFGSAQQFSYAPSASLQHPRSTSFHHNYEEIANYGARPGYQDDVLRHSQQTSTVVADVGSASATYHSSMLTPTTVNSRSGAASFDVTNSNSNVVSPPQQISNRLYSHPLMFQMNGQYSPNDSTTGHLSTCYTRHLPPNTGPSPQRPPLPYIRSENSPAALADTVSTYPVYTPSTTANTCSASCSQQAPSSGAVLEQTMMGGNQPEKCEDHMPRGDRENLLARPLTNEHQPPPPPTTSEDNRLDQVRQRQVCGPQQGAVPIGAAARQGASSSVSMSDRSTSETGQRVAGYGRNKGSNRQRLPANEASASHSSDVNNHSSNYQYHGRGRGSYHYRPSLRGNERWNNSNNRNHHTGFSNYHHGSQQQSYRNSSTHQQYENKYQRNTDGRQQSPRSRASFTANITNGAPAAATSVELNSEGAAVLSPFNSVNNEKDNSTFVASEIASVAQPAAVQMSTAVSAGVKPTGPSWADRVKQAAAAAAASSTKQKTTTAKNTAVTGKHAMHVSGKPSEATSNAMNHRRGQQQVGQSNTVSSTDSQEQSTKHVTQSGNAATVSNFKRMSSFERYSNNTNSKHQPAVKHSISGRKNTNVHNSNNRVSTGKNSITNKQNAKEVSQSKGYTKQMSDEHSLSDSKAGSTDEVEGTSSQDQISGESLTEETNVAQSSRATISSIPPVWIPTPLPLQQQDLQSVTSSVSSTDFASKTSGRQIIVTNHQAQQGDSPSTRRRIENAPLTISQQRSSTVPITNSNNLIFGTLGFQSHDGSTSTASEGVVLRTPVSSSTLSSAAIPLPTSPPLATYEATTVPSGTAMLAPDSGVFNRGADQVYTTTVEQIPLTGFYSSSKDESVEFIAKNLSSSESTNNSIEVKVHENLFNERAKNLMIAPTVMEEPVEILSSTIEDDSKPAVSASDADELKTEQPASSNSDQGGLNLIQNPIEEIQIESNSIDVELKHDIKESADSKFTKNVIEDVQIESNSIDVEAKHDITESADSKFTKNVIEDVQIESSSIDAEVKHDITESVDSNSTKNAIEESQIESSSINIKDESNINLLVNTIFENEEDMQAKIATNECCQPVVDTQHELLCVEEEDIKNQDNIITLPPDHEQSTTILVEAHKNDTDEICLESVSSEVVDVESQPSLISNNTNTINEQEEEASSFLDQQQMQSTLIDDEEGAATSNLTNACTSQKIDDNTSDVSSSISISEEAHEHVIVNNRKVSMASSLSQDEETKSASSVNEETKSEKSIQGTLLVPHDRTTEDTFSYSIPTLLRIRAAVISSSTPTTTGDNTSDSMMTTPDGTTKYSLPFLMSRKPGSIGLRAAGICIPDSIRKRGIENISNSPSKTTAAEDIWRFSATNNRGGKSSGGLSNSNILPSSSSAKSLSGNVVSNAVSSANRGGGRRSNLERSSSSRDVKDDDVWRTAKPIPSENSRVGRASQITDHSELIHRKLRSILNKLTVEKFETLYEQIKTAGMKNEADVQGLMELICSKAKVQHHFIPMYVRLCSQLNNDLPGMKITESKTSPFRRLLVDACQSSFEETLNPIVVPDGLPEEDAFEYILLEKKKMKGNMIFVAELSKKKMIAAKILKSCMEVLISNGGEPQLEALCELMTSAGHHISSNIKLRGAVDQSMSTIEALLQNDDLSMRIRCLLQDVVDDWKSGWKKSTMEKEGPKTLDQIQRQQSGGGNNESIIITTSTTNRDKLLTSSSIAALLPGSNTSSSGARNLGNISSTMQRTISLTDSNKLTSRHSVNSHSVFNNNNNNNDDDFLPVTSKRGMKSNRLSQRDLTKHNGNNMITSSSQAPLLDHRDMIGSMNNNNNNNGFGTVNKTTTTIGQEYNHMNNKNGLGSTITTNSSSTGRTNTNNKNHSSDSKPRETARALESFFGPGLALSTASSSLGAPLQRPVASHDIQQQQQRSNNSNIQQQSSVTNNTPPTVGFDVNDTTASTTTHSGTSIPVSSSSSSSSSSTSAIVSGTASVIAETKEEKEFDGERWFDILSSIASTLSSKASIELGVASLKAALEDTELTDSNLISLLSHAIFLVADARVQHQGIVAEWLLSWRRHNFVSEQVFELGFKDFLEYKYESTKWDAPNLASIIIDCILKKGKDLEVMSDNFLDFIEAEVRRLDAAY